MTAIKVQEGFISRNLVHELRFLGSLLVSVIHQI